MPVHNDTYLMHLLCTGGRTGSLFMRTAAISSTLRDGDESGATTSVYQ